MKIPRIYLLFPILVLSGCGGNFIGKDTAATTSSVTLNPGESEPGARIIFRDTDFTDLSDFVNSPNTTHQCLGDVMRMYYVDGEDYMGTPTPLPTPSILDALLPTNRPVFVRNVSVDITNTYYATIQSGSFASDTCSNRSVASAPAPSSCADFDHTPANPSPAPTIAATPTPNPTPVASVTPATEQYFDNALVTNHFYRVRDDWCTSQGPTVSPDPEVTKAGVGGVSIDLDRTQLGANEDLLMVVTYHALNENSGKDNWPETMAVDSAGTPILSANRHDHTANDRTILKVNLIATQQSLDTLLKVAQPRPWAYANTSTYPIYIKEIATLEDPLGSLRTEQVYIPLSQNGLVDRIRIDRVRGSYHLYQVDLYRLGNRTE